MAEPVDAADSKSAARKGVRVRVSLPAHARARKRLRGGAAPRSFYLDSLWAPA